MARPGAEALVAGPRHVCRQDRMAPAWPAKGHFFVAARARSMQSCHVGRPGIEHKMSGSANLVGSRS
jgi:hypothetical protein